MNTHIRFSIIPPTHKKVTYRGMMIDTIRDGKIVRRQGIWDRLGLKEQLLDNEEYQCL